MGGQPHHVIMKRYHLNLGINCMRSEAVRADSIKNKCYGSVPVMYYLNSMTFFCLCLCRSESMS